MNFVLVNTRTPTRGNAANGTVEANRGIAVNARSRAIDGYTDDAAIADLDQRPA
ncbi:MAG: hypothetical protein ACP5P1_09530 [Acidimicrobiales bacterium]